MNPKKIYIDLLVIIIALLLFMAWYNDFRKDKVLTATSVNRFYKIYLITADKEYQYWDLINQGAAKMAATTGVTYVWDAPAKRDINLQIEVINNAINNGANALLIAADDPKKISSVVEDAKARGVKVIYVDSPAYEEAITTLATDNYEAGRIAGETMISILNKYGFGSGKIGIISVESKANTSQREMGFLDTLKADGRYQLIDTVYTPTGDPNDAQVAAERLIQENSDLVGLFGTNEGTSIGVGNAIKANNNRIVGIGFDKTDTMLQLLEEGSLKALIAQNPYTMGYLGMAEAIAALKGYDTGPIYFNTGITVIENE